MMGVPLEASINFGGDGIEIEDLEDGDSAEVYGTTMSGPMVIVRKWPLRGVAVCPYGADMNTATTFASGNQEISYTVTKHKELDVGKLTQDTKEVETVETEKKVVDTEEGVGELTDVVVTVEAGAKAVDTDIVEEIVE